MICGARKAGSEYRRRTSCRAGAPAASRRLAAGPRSPAAPRRGKPQQRQARLAQGRSRRAPGEPPPAASPCMPPTPAAAQPSRWCSWLKRNMAGVVARPQSLTSPVPPLTSPSASAVSSSGPDRRGSRPGGGRARAGGRVSRRRSVQGRGHGARWGTAAGAGWAPAAPRSARRPARQLGPAGRAPMPTTAVQPGCRSCSHLEKPTPMK
jgi:hypothetical protein